jgi:hypothetical protein
MVVGIGIVEFQQLIVPDRLRIRSAHRIIIATGSLLIHQVLAADAIDAAIGIEKSERRKIGAIAVTPVGGIVNTNGERTAHGPELMPEKEIVVQVEAISLIIVTGSPGYCQIRPLQAFGKGKIRIHAMALRMLYGKTWRIQYGIIGIDEEFHP